MNERSVHLRYELDCLEVVGSTGTISTSIDQQAKATHSVDEHADPAELLRRLTGLVDDILRLSNTNDRTLAGSGRSCDWTILDYADKLTCVTGCNSEVQLTRHEA